MKLLRYLALALPLMAAVSCGDPEPTPEEQPAPALLSTDPANGVTGVDESQLTVKFTFDQNIKVSAEGRQSIKVDGGATVGNISSYGPELTVELIGLSEATSYTLTLPEAAVQGFRTNQKATPAIVFAFSTVTPEPLDPPGSGDAAGWEYASSAAHRMGTGWNLGNTLESFNEMLDANGTWNHSTTEAHEVINKWNADFVATVRATGGNNAHRNLILNTYAASTDNKALQDFRLPAMSRPRQNTTFLACTGCPSATRRTGLPLNGHRLR